MREIPFSFYPPGAEHDPCAPYNQDEAKDDDQPDGEPEPDYGPEEL